MRLQRTIMGGGIVASTMPSDGPTTGRHHRSLRNDAAQLGGSHSFGPPSQSASKEEREGDEFSWRGGVLREGIAAECLRDDRARAPSGSCSLRGQKRRLRVLCCEDRRSAIVSNACTE
jgi:hypothetical protein